MCLKLFSIIFVLFLNQISVNCNENQLNLIEKSNRLSLKLLNVLPQNQNNFYSPLSITYSLYLLLNGADTQTEAELKNLLNIGSNGKI